MMIHLKGNNFAEWPKTISLLNLAQINFFYFAGINLDLYCLELKFMN